jgi:hypothetical protein
MTYIPTIHAETSPWSQASPGPDILSPVRVTVSRSDGWHSRLRVACDLRAHHDLRALGIDIACETAWALTHDRRLAPITEPTSPPMPAGSFVIVQRDGALQRIAFPWAGGLRLRKTTRGVHASCRIQDRRSCGLIDWGEHKLDGDSRSFEFEITCDRLASLEDCVWVEPYPEGCPGALCITDHPDFDTLEKARPLFDAVTASGVRLTKGVFPSSAPQGEKREPGLDVHEYLSLIRTLHEAGSEIAFHGLGPRVDAPPLDECRRRADRMLEFAPQTWIDHGTGRYLFVRDSMLPGGSSLREFLQPYGIRNYWSYFDVWDNPFLELSCQRGRARSTALVDLIASGAELMREPRAERMAASALYLFMHSARNIAGARALELVRGKRIGIEAFASVRTAARVHRAVASDPMAIYALDGAAAAASADADWVFDTVVLNHPAIQLRADTLQRLARRSGLVLAHTYLCATHAYLAGGAFQARASQVAIAPAFRRMLRELELARRSRQIATVSFAELRRCLTNASQVRTVRMPSGWMVDGLSAEQRTWVGGAGGIREVALGDHWS